MTGGLRGQSISSTHALAVYFLDSICTPLPVMQKVVPSIFTNGHTARSFSSLTALQVGPSSSLRQFVQPTSTYKWPMRRERKISHCQRLLSPVHCLCSAEDFGQPKMRFIFTTSKKFDAKPTNEPERKAAYFCSSTYSVAKTCAQWTLGVVAYLH